jgi:type I restriction enzyme S subunit
MAICWKECRLGDVLTLKRGFDLPKRDRQPGPYPLVSSSGVTDHLAVAKVKGPGVVTGRYGTLGEVFFIRDDFWPLNTSLYVENFKGNDPRYVALLLSQLSLGNRSAAGAVPGVNRNHLHLLDVRIPPVPIQTLIADLLYNYDDLIAINNRRISILNEMARRIYREWFVNFRFPGHDKLPLVPSPVGNIPKGWEVRTLAQIADNFDRLRKPLSKMQRAEIQGEYPYYGAAKVFDHINDFIFDGEYLLVAEDGSVITTERTPVLQLVNERFWPNNHTHVLRGKPPFSTHFLYLSLADVDISPYITGAAQPKITQENMNRIPLVCGPEKLHETFNQLVAPMISTNQILQRQIKNLHRTRDHLLPRLMSGKVDVSHINVEPATLTA